jgi:type II secretory pathway pseudopilin PulG
MDRLLVSDRRSGITVVEVIVLLVLIGATALLLLMGVSRAREQARLVGCRQNLGQIGLALALYDQIHQKLPEIAQPGGDEGQAPTKSPGPLKILLETLELPDLTELRDRSSRPKPRPGQVPGGIPVPGFVCGSDSNALAGWFRAPISYRAVTGDNPRGDNGTFAPLRKHSLAAIEAGDGLSYTAAFSERLVGDNRTSHPAPHNYQMVSPPLPSGGCPETSDPSSWRGDAGSSWPSCDYRSTLYNHALPPNGHPSCLEIDGRRAYMGASSGHVRGVNLLRLDGSVTLVRPSIDRKIWGEFARINPPVAGVE